MVDNVRITFDASIQEQMSTEDIVKLAESLHSFVDFGLIDCEEDEELYIDHDYLEELVISIENIRKATKKYGRSTDGLVKYPFWGVA